MTPLFVVHIYRYIKDGEGSRTVFNGIDALVDLRFSRGNRMIGGKFFIINNCYIIAHVLCSMAAKLSTLT